MRKVLNGVLVGIVAVLMLVGTGCVSKDQYNTCVRRNQAQQEIIDMLRAQQAGGSTDLEQCRQGYAALAREKDLIEKKVQALAAAVDAKNAIIAQLTEQIGQSALPVELSDALADWAASVGSDTVAFDAERGIVRFKSDVLFDKGSDAVKDTAKQQIGKLSSILSSNSAQGFDVLVVGHTDDLPLGPATRAKHTSNWHLSAHRAIAVENILAGAGLAPDRIAVMGMGEYRPIEPNAAGKKGNPKNRRVEIYIVPSGRMTP